MHISDMIIEITRQCNLSCEHCLRGRKQNINIDPMLIDKFIQKNNITSIGMLTITGGEPCMNSQGFLDIVNILKRHKVNIYGFYMATNGMFCDEKVLTALGLLAEQCYDEESFIINISKDSFHDNYKNTHPIWNIIKTSPKTTPKDGVIYEGYGKRFGNHDRIIKEDKWYWDDSGIYEGQVYINALGMLLKDCDYSYSSQKKKNIGHCLEHKLKDFPKSDYKVED